MQLCHGRPEDVVAACLAFSAVGLNAAAHGPNEAQHGGVVRAAGDLSFELVAKGDTTELVVVDHDAPADFGNMSGKRTVLNGTEKSEAVLRPAGGNKLETATNLGKGSKAVVAVNVLGGKAITVRAQVG